MKKILAILLVALAITGAFAYDVVGLNNGPTSLIFVFDENSSKYSLGDLDYLYEDLEENYGFINPQVYESLDMNQLFEACFEIGATLAEANLELYDGSYQLSMEKDGVSMILVSINQEDFESIMGDMF